MSATIPSVYLAQQNKQMEVWLPPEVKNPETLNKTELFPASLHCAFHHANIDFGLCFLPKLAGEFVIVMVYAALFLKYSLFSLFCYTAVNHKSMI